MDSLGGFWLREKTWKQRGSLSELDQFAQTAQFFSWQHFSTQRGVVKISLQAVMSFMLRNTLYYLEREERRKEKKKKKRQDGLDSCSFRSQRKYPLLFHFFIKPCHVNLVCCLITHFEMESVPSCSVPCTAAEAGQPAGMQGQAGSTVCLRAPDADQKKWLKQLRCTDPLRKQITHLFALP